MIIIGAYPLSFSCERDTQSPIQQLDAMLEIIVPRGMTLHLLPFYPSDGDGGFAPSHWFSVEPTFGSLTDITAIARRHPLFVDGIYNHVGISHEWCRQFFSGEGGADRLCILPDSAPLPSAMSPRGFPVVREHLVGGLPKLVWQTFSPLSVDLNLDNRAVNEEILRHLDFLKRVGVQGIRLDAPAYYGKPINAPQRHSADSIRIFRRISNMCHKRGFEVVAQLNCDDKGLSYISGPFVPLLQDYSLPALIALAIVDADVAELVRHLKTTWWQERVIRPLRTHDGILLKTGASDDQRLVSTARRFRRYGISPRQIKGVDYELNDSFPHICSIGATRQQSEDAIVLALTLLMLIPGSPYLYLPALCGWQPEAKVPTVSRAGSQDPRLVNRIPIDSAHVESIKKNGFLERVYSNLAKFHSIRTTYGFDRPHELDSICMLAEGVLAIGRQSRFVAVLNFRRDRAWQGFSPFYCPEGSRRSVVVSPRSALFWDLSGPY